MLRDIGWVVRAVGRWKWGLEGLLEWVGCMGWYRVSIEGCLMWVGEGLGLVLGAFLDFR